MDQQWSLSCGLINDSELKRISDPIRSDHLIMWFQVCLFVVLLASAQCVSSSTLLESTTRFLDLKPDAQSIRLLPSKLVSPSQAIKLNRYRQAKMKIQVPVNSKHKLRFQNYPPLDIGSIQPEIEVPSSRSTPLSLVFKFSSSPLNVQQRYYQQLLPQEPRLLDGNLNEKSTFDYMTIPGHPNRMFSNSAMNDAEVLLLSSNLYDSRNNMHRKRPRIGSNSKMLHSAVIGNGAYQQPFETIEQMMAAQDMSATLYEPLLLNSLAENLSHQESMMTTWYATDEKWPPFLALVDGDGKPIQTVNFDQPATMSSYVHLAQIQPQYLIGQRSIATQIPVDTMANLQKS